MRFVRRARNHRRSFGKGKRFGGKRRFNKARTRTGMSGRSGIRVGYRM